MKPICMHKPILIHRYICMHSLCKTLFSHIGTTSTSRRITRLKAGAHCLLILAVALMMLPSFTFLLNNAHAHTPNTTIIRVIPESRTKSNTLASTAGLDAVDAKETVDAEEVEEPLLVEVEFEVNQMLRLVGIEDTNEGSITGFFNLPYLTELRDNYTDEITNYVTTNLKITNQNGALIELKRHDSYDIQIGVGIEGQSLFTLTLEPLTELRGEIISLSYDSVLNAVPEHTISVLALAPADDAQDADSVPAVNDTSTVDPSSDISNGVDATQLKLAGILSNDTRSITVDLSNPALSFWSLIVEGYEHVLEGLDHLLFVLLLAIPAPLVITAGKWSNESEDGVLHTFIRIVHVLTAFTVGHTITLIAAARGWVDLPSTLTETTIAVSVAVGAVHLIKPIPFFHSRAEPAIAVLFGLIHGLAFAGLLDGIGIGAERAIGDLLAFNIGVELAQILTVVLLFPAIILLALSFGWFLVRIAVAVFSLLIASGWVLERLTDIDSPLGTVEDAMLNHQVILVLLFYLLSGVAYAVTMVARYGNKSSRISGSSSSRKTSGSRKTSTTKS